MAAPTEPQPGIGAIIVVGGTKIGSQTEATLNLPAESTQITTKQNYGWAESLPGTTEWSLDSGNLIKDSGGDPFLSNDQADRTKVEIFADRTTDGTDNAQYHAIPKLTSVDVTLTQETEQVSTHDGGLVQALYLGQRNMQLDIEGLYLDPDASASEIQALLDARKNGERLTLRTTIDQYTLEADFALTDFTPMDGSAEASPISFSASFESDGVVTTGGTDLDASVQQIFDAYFNQTLVTAGLELHDGGGKITGATKFEGDGYFTEVSFSAETESEASMSGTVMGDGAISTVTQ